MSIKRARLSPDESRHAAVEAARMLLIEAGPQAVTLKAVAARIGRRFGLTARLVAMEKAEACIDADKPDDVVLIERIVAARG